MNCFKVTLFVYNLTWPENKSPPNTSIFLELILQTQLLHKENSSILVHSQTSNASVFIALSILLDQLKSENSVDICSTVKRLKRQRNGMIESYVRLYPFLHFKQSYIN
jgi:protein-tyrosine phosphatase